MDADSQKTTGGELSPAKRALIEIRELRARLQRVEEQQRDPIAIVGLGCRFPGAENPDAFWTLLHEGRDAIRDVPADRWDADRLFDPDPDAAGKLYARRGGFLDGVDLFDARFFGINPREAASMDPQQRLLLEVSWEALEDAGQAPDRLIGQPVGVFVGMGAGDYLLRQVKGLESERVDVYLGTGGSAAVASGRLSYVYGFQGPSITIDTACSASLVAVHLACQSLRARECRMALAGGASLMLMPELTMSFCRARMLAPDGRCKTFDAAADGYVRSEGCGVVVLKRLSDALATGDRVLAVIRGSAVNQDGRSSGLTVPNGPAQEAVVREALAQARLAPSQVSYVEAHGTGTSLGDPIELGALGSVFREGRPSNRPLAVGSVKTNIGHLEAAAGIAGLIKVVLALGRGVIPPHLHLRQPNPLVDWTHQPLSVPTVATPWPDSEGPRVAGVSSFGFSGTNAHVIVEQAPARPPLPAQTTELNVLPLSAKTADALKEVATRTLRRLESSDASFGDICFTAGTGRAHFGHRLGIVSDSTAGGAAALRSFLAGDLREVRHGAQLEPTPPEVAFLFTGQGCQYAGMGRVLYEAEPVFRAAIDRCAAILEPHLDRPLVSLLFGADGFAVDETIYTQPALFALEFALAEVWRSWGITPSVVMGHSLGEDVAACVAGVFSLEEGLPLIAARGRLMQALPRDGEMVCVFASEEAVLEAVAPFSASVAVAAVNGPESVTVSGERGAVRRIVAGFDARGHKVRAVTASHAFHSPLMDPILDSFERAARQISYREPALPLISTLTGRPAGRAELCSAAYWRRHIRECVRFGDSIQALWDRGSRVFIEIGPHPVLLGMGQRVVTEGGVWLPSFRRDRDARREMLSSLAGAYAVGLRIDWEGVHRERSRSKVALPAYPFERERYWVDLAPIRRAVPAVDSARVWQRGVDAARRQAEAGPLDLNLATYPAKWARLEEIAIASMIAALRRFGVFGSAGERWTADRIVEDAHIRAEYRGLLQRWLSELAARGHLRADEGAYVSDRSLAGADPSALIAASRPLFADYRSILDYIERCSSRLVEVLTGKESALETLFPDGSSSLADALYRTSPVSRYLNGIVHGAVEGLLAARAGNPVRILEIGAGTGGTTAALVPLLEAGRTAYSFTDVGPLFLSKAQDQFANVPDLEFRLLDIEQHPERQGFAAHEYDIVVAANVLHATKDLHRTLDHVAWLLGADGALVLYEATTHPIWFDVTTGLISGWQRFADDLRRDVPLLRPEAWAGALQQHGFAEVVAFPQPESPASMLGLHVMVVRGGAAPAAMSTSSGRASVSAPAVAAPPAQGAPEQGGILQELAALPEAERHERLVAFVRDRVVQVLRLDARRPPDRRQRLMDFGVDSLMAVEFRNVLTKALGLKKKLPATLIFDHPTVEAIARHLQRSGVLGSPAPSPARVVAPPAAAAPTERGALEQMDDAEVEALLNKRLEVL